MTYNEYKNIDEKPLNLFIESNKLSKLDTLNDMLKEIKLEKSKIKTLLVITSFLVHILLFYYEKVVDAHKSQV